MFLSSSLFSFSYPILHFIPKLYFHLFSLKWDCAPLPLHIYYLITHRLLILNSSYSRDVLLVSSLHPSFGSDTGTGRRHYYCCGVEVFVGEKESWIAESTLPTTLLFWLLLTSNVSTCHLIYTQSVNFISATTLSLFALHFLYYYISKCVHIAYSCNRCVSPQKVWYEWGLTSPVITPVQNPNGQSYWVGL